MDPRVIAYLISNIRREMEEIARQAPGACVVANPPHNVLANQNHPLGARYSILLRAAQALNAGMMIELIGNPGANQWQFQVVQVQ
jgi:hypothetical protein